jgi:hypothetical protein
MFPRIVISAKHALFLLRNLGLRRFTIVFICWLVRQYRGWVGPVSPRAGDVLRDPVLVYQMSKVGSTSLMYSLQMAYLRAGYPRTPLYHAHTLTNLDLHERLVKDAKGPVHHLALVREYKQIRARFESSPNEHWTVISLVRDPVARLISDYFHHIDRHLPDWRSRWANGQLQIEHVLEHFLTVVDPTQHWFEGESLGVLGIDVYAQPFPQERGYAVYTRLPKVTLMVIRLEDMDRVAKGAIEKLLGLKGLTLHRFNLGTESDYGEIYRQFKNCPLPEWYLEKAYNGRMACHFYTRGELDRFAEKWSRRSCVAQGAR